MNAAGPSHRGGGIHAHQSVETGPIFDEREHVAVPDEKRDIGRQPAG